MQDGVKDKDSERPVGVLEDLGRVASRVSVNGLLDPCLWSVVDQTVILRLI